MQLNYTAYDAGEFKNEASDHPSRFFATIADDNQILLVRRPERVDEPLTGITLEHIDDIPDDVELSRDVLCLSNPEVPTEVSHLPRLSHDDVEAAISLLETVVDSASRQSSVLAPSLNSAFNTLTKAARLAPGLEQSLINIIEGRTDGVLDATEGAKALLRSI